MQPPHLSSNSKKTLSLFAICTVLPCLFLYSCIIYSGAGVSGGSILTLALMWVPGLGALVTKLTVDHSVRGIGWRIHKSGLRSFVSAYLIPLGLCLIVYGLAWLTGPYTQNLTSEFGTGLAIGYTVIAFLIYKHCRKEHNCT